MSYQFSLFGERLGSKTGILELMDDLGRAMSAQGQSTAVDPKSMSAENLQTSNPPIKYMLGGGNPAAIPDMAAVWRRSMQELLTRPADFDAMLGNYDVPQGRPRFIDALVEFFNARFRWNLTREHIAITAGSQCAYFCLFNMLAGAMPDGRKRRIQLPLMPEYIGYADQGILPETFVSTRPRIEHLGPHSFKYFVDFQGLHVSNDVAAIAVSRPTNPTGNVLTDDEIQGLSDIAKKRSIPLIIDNAYGAPFPHIIFSEITPWWDEHIILTLSLSKLGLPGARTGIVIAHPDIVRRISALNAVINLAMSNVGQELVTPLLETGEIDTLSRSVIQPFYQARRDFALDCITKFFPDSIPYGVHVCEGSPFLWLWFRDLPVTGRELYERLKQRGVLVVPGNYFFYGLEEEWRHTDECIRINYSQPEPIVGEGLRLIGEEIGKAYA